jgi:hypothetical protein
MVNCLGSQPSRTDPRQPPTAIASNCSKPISLNNVPRINQRREVEANNIHLQFDSIVVLNHSADNSILDFPVVQVHADSVAYLGTVHPSPFILANNSDRSIVGLVVQWTYTNAGGNPIINNTRSDSFMQMSNRAVIHPHSRLLVGPGTFLSEALAGEPHAGNVPIEKLDGSGHREMSSASDLTSKIDVIIFGDGEVVGPNSNHFDTELQNRKLAAGVVARQARNAMAKGEDPKIALSRILESSPSRNDTLGKWTVRYAQMLLREPNSFDAQLRSLENLPEPPNFFRKGN